jgi:hypothetical protein
MTDARTAGLDCVDGVVGASSKIMNYPLANPLEAVELVLRSVFRSPCLASAEGGGFHVSQPRSGTEIHFAAAALLDAALFIRRNASSHLRSLSIEDLQQMLVHFISDEMDIFGLGWWQLPRGVPFAAHVTAEGKAELAEVMARSPMFAPPKVLFLYPIKVAKVTAPFRSQSFFMLPPEDLPPELSHWYDPDEIKPDRHPPTPMHAEIPLNEVSCWLGVRSPSGENAVRTRNAILGACALLPHPFERYQFSIATVPTGHMSFHTGATYHSGDASTPALSEKLQIGKADHAWLTLLVQKLESNADRDRKAVLALQYFYRAWVRDPATRVAPLCGALDALFGDRDAATQAMVDAVGANLGPSFDATAAFERPAANHRSTGFPACSAAYRRLIDNRRTRTSRVHPALPVPDEL